MQVYSSSLLLTKPRFHLESPWSQERWVGPRCVCVARRMGLWDRYACWALLGTWETIPGCPGCPPLRLCHLQLQSLPWNHDGTTLKTKGPTHQAQQDRTKERARSLTILLSSWVDAAITFLQISCYMRKKFCSKYVRWGFRFCFVLWSITSWHLKNKTKQNYSKQTKTIFFGMYLGLIWKTSWETFVYKKKTKETWFFLF